MKFTTIYLDENKITFSNSWLGKETIHVNDELVSSKYSFGGTEHLFTIPDKNGVANCKLVTGFGNTGVVIDLYKNDKPIIESPKNGSAIALFLLFGMAVGFVIVNYFAN